MGSVQHFRVRSRLLVYHGNFTLSAFFSVPGDRTLLGRYGMQEMSKQVADLVGLGTAAYRKASTEAVFFPVGQPTL